jgi:hypothetical protein
MQMRPKGTGLARGRVEGRQPSRLRKSSKSKSGKLRRIVILGVTAVELQSLEEGQETVGFQVEAYNLDIYHTFRSSGFGAARDFGVAAS